MNGFLDRLVMGTGFFEGFLVNQIDAEHRTQVIKMLIDGQYANIFCD